MLTATTFLAAFAVGATTHIFILHRLETQRHIHKIVFGTLGALLTLTTALKSLAHLPIVRAAATTAVLSIACFAGAIISTTIYRIFFHPLNKTPGPFGARLSDFWMAIQVGSSLKQFRVLEDLHNRYGDIVRTGANSVSIVDPNFIAPSYTPPTKVTKGSWYDVDYPESGLLGERDTATHHRRRRGWAPAFSDKALREYEPMVKTFNNKFLQKVGEHRGGPMDVSKWFNLFSFDVMGALAFGKNYGMLDSGEMHAVLGLLTDAMAPLGLTLPTWFVRLAKLIPGAMSGVIRFHDFCTAELASAVHANLQQETEKIHGIGKTISSELLKQYEHEPQPEKNGNFIADAKLLIVAGSDTIAITMTWLFYELARNPDEQTKLRENLKVLSLIRGQWSDKDIRDCKHLNAAIHEVLRLHPPGPSGKHRLTPPEGMQVGGVHVPGGVQFQLPFYMISRDERVYADASSFIPERWYSRPELVRHKSAFMPFLLGQYSCLGKALAMIEMRTLTAALLLQFDVAFAPGETGHRLEHESKDHFTSSLAPLELAFTPLRA